MRISFKGNVFQLIATPFKFWEGCLCAHMLELTPLPLARGSLPQGAPFLSSRAASSRCQLSLNLKASMDCLLHVSCSFSQPDSKFLRQRKILSLLMCSHLLANETTQELAKGSLSEPGVCDGHGNATTPIPLQS